MEYLNCTWRCDICGDIRGDKFIDVISKPLIIRGRNAGVQNIKYCNDRHYCITGSQTYLLVKDT